ncbi:MAG: multidrug efflux pump subunit AcrA (membrane-fusion protein) [Acidimicrobiales bacterium]|jgi:multidrug efflux pump subunit AcrA (membrane-fusion protein)
MQRIIIEIIKDIRMYFKPTTTKGLLRLVVLVVILAASCYLFFLNNTETFNDVPEQLPTVRVTSVQDITSQSNVTIIGTVRAVNEAQIQSEVAGRVTHVPVTLGQQISAGQIIAQTENAGQRASVLQAQGVYEAALASAQTSLLSVSDAENNLVKAQNTSYSKLETSYTNANNVYYSYLDDIFADEDNEYRSSGVVLRKTGSIISANDQRFRDLDTVFNNHISSDQNLDTLSTQFQEAYSLNQELLTIIGTFRSLITDSDIDTAYSSTAINYLSVLNTAQAQINADIATLQSSETALQDAYTALEKARVNGARTGESVANAQVKQALGALRGAQANLNKTIMRSPITGEVNSLSVNTGDFITAYTLVAEVANNNALEISATVSEKDSNRISVGQIVSIENTLEGVITAIAPAIDSLTKKIEVKIATESEEITNGETVHIAIYDTNTKVEDKSLLLIPITAIKFADIDGVVFTVEQTTLTAHPIKLGNIYGSSVEILEGVTGDMELVIDARGLSEGQQVEAIKNN